MKSFMVSLAALVIPSLGYPNCHWMPSQVSHPPHAVDAGTIEVSNYAPFDVHVNEEPQGSQYDIAPGKQISVPGASVADIKFNEEVEVSYVSGDEGTFNYVINPIGNFPACVAVQPDGCGSLKWCPGDPPMPPVTCTEGTKLPVTLYQPA